MKYAIYFTYADGDKDTVIDEGAKQRDIDIADLNSRNDVVDLIYCKIYADGEYGELRRIK